MRVGSTERGSLSALAKDTPCDGLKTARAPVVATQHKGGMMAAKSFAAVWSVRLAGEHVHEPRPCDGEVFTNSGNGLLCCEPAEGATLYTCRNSPRVRSSEHGSP